MNYYDVFVKVKKETLIFGEMYTMTFEGLPINKNNQEEIIDIKGPEHLFFFEAELASQSIAKEKLQAPHPAMSWEDTLGNLKALDQWRNKVNYKLSQDDL